MRRVSRCRSLCLLIGLFAALAAQRSAAQAQPGVSWDGSWECLGQPSPELLGAEPWVRPAHLSIFRADLGALGRQLAQAPLEFTREAVERPLLVAIPMPTGEYQAFEIVESPVMEPGLARKFPEIRTYVGQGLDDPAATVRLDLTPQGFHAQVLSPSGRVMVDPFNRGDSVHYASYAAADNPRTEDWACLGAIEPPTRDAPLGGGGFTGRVG